MCVVRVTWLELCDLLSERNEETAETPACVTHLVLVDHNGSAGSCYLAESGLCELATWKHSQVDEVVQLGWVHSHHGLSQQPSAADLEQQVKLQTLAPSSVMVVLKPGSSAKAWTIPRPVHADLRVMGVNASYPATDPLENVEIVEKEQSPAMKVVIRGRLLDLAATCRACLDSSSEPNHTLVAGACNQARIDVETPSLHGGARETEKPCEMEATSARVGTERPEEMAAPSAHGGTTEERTRRTLRRASSEPVANPVLPLAAQSTLLAPQPERRGRLRRVASDSNTLLPPEAAQTSSIDTHNESMLMNFFRKKAAEVKGAFVMRNIMAKMPLPLGAQTIEQANKSWAASMKTLQEKKNQDRQARPDGLQ